MNTRYTILESDSGEDLGTLTVDDESPEEMIIETLVHAGYLDPPADTYSIDESYPFSEEGDLVIVDAEGEPRITLEADEWPDTDETGDDPDDADELTETEDLNGEDIL